MLEIIAIVLISIVFGKLLQEKIGLPSNIFYIIIGLILTHFFPNIFDLGGENGFHYIVLITLPFLIASDTFGITWKEIKKNYLSILLLAFVNVIFTVVAIVIFGNFILPTISTIMLIILASTISPTDPVGVSASLSNFKVPHKLKFKLESESLANDVVAIAIFSITLLVLLGEINTDIVSLANESIRQLSFALLIGLIIGYIALFFLSKSFDAYYEAFVVLTATFVGFFISDHYLHVSGIFTVIVIMIVINEKIKQIWKKDKKKNHANIVHPENHNFVGRILYFLSDLSNAFLFIALGSLVDFFNFDSFVWHYAILSLYIFLFITIVRASFMYFYSHLSVKTKKINNIDNFRWWAVLTFGGMRGGLSILMIFMLSEAVPDYEYLEEIKAIVFNVVFLITFIYTPILIGVFKKYNKKFDEEYNSEKGMIH